MFRQLAQLLTSVYQQDYRTASNAVLTNYRPGQLTEFLEVFWNAARNPTRQAALQVTQVVRHREMGRTGVLDPMAPPPPVDPPIPPLPLTYHHLVYAAMWDYARTASIFKRMIFELVHGERLPYAREETQRWLHTTEQLFFGSAWPYSVRSVTSEVRPDRCAVRRNAVWRMLGWNIPDDSDRPYPYVKAEAANRDFSALFEALLTEVWRGYINRLTFLNTNETDDDAILTLVRRIREMLTARRQFGTLSREEFDAVATMSWFHLTLETNTDIVNNFNITGSGVADRLKKLGELVGLPAHARTDAFIQLSQPMSDLLIQIESRTVEAAGARSLYDGPFTPDMLRIMTHWSIATGRNIKDPALRQPVGAVLSAAARPVAVMIAPSQAPVLTT